MTLIEKFGIGVVLGVWLLVILGFIGWFMNVYKLVKLDFQAPYKTEIIRTVGLIPPVGALVGWIHIND